MNSVGKDLLTVCIEKNLNDYVYEQLIQQILKIPDFTSSEDPHQGSDIRKDHSSLFSSPVSIARNKTEQKHWLSFLVFYFAAIKYYLVINLGETFFHFLQKGHM